MAEPSFQRGTSFHRSHHRGVESDAGVKAEISTIHPAETHPRRWLVEGVGHKGRGCQRVVRKANRASEDIGRATGQHRERSVAAGESGGGFIQRAVTSEGRHHVHTTPCCISCKAGRVPTAIGLDHLDVMSAGSAERTVHEHRVAGRHRRRERVDNEQHPHRARR